MSSRRDAKFCARSRPSSFLRSRKVDPESESEDEIIQSPKFKTQVANHQSTATSIVYDPFEAGNFFSEEQFFPYDDDNFVLDANQDLPIRKPQSAYVIFGKLVSLFPPLRSTHKFWNSLL